MMWVKCKHTNDYFTQEKYLLDLFQKHNMKRIYFINIEAQINHLDINKQPNQNQYDQKIDNITLTCIGNGNPQATYVWFKKGHNSSILSNKSFYIIKNVIRNNSGVYICEGYNIIEDIIYRKSNSVDIYIGELIKND